MRDLRLRSSASPPVLQLQVKLGTVLHALSESIQPWEENSTIDVLPPQFRESLLSAEHLSWSSAEFDYGPLLIPFLERA